jgi:hypothetical protein
MSPGKFNADAPQYLSSRQIEFGCTYGPCRTYWMRVGIASGAAFVCVATRRAVVWCMLVWLFDHRIDYMRASSKRSHDSRCCDEPSIIRDGAMTWRIP